MSKVTAQQLLSILSFQTSGELKVSFLNELLRNIYEQKIVTQAKAFSSFTKKFNDLIKETDKALKKMSREELIRYQNNINEIYDVIKFEINEPIKKLLLELNSSIENYVGIASPNQSRSHSNSQSYKAKISQTPAPKIDTRNEKIKKIDDALYEAEGLVKNRHQEIKVSRTFAYVHDDEKKQSKLSRLQKLDDFLAQSRALLKELGAHIKEDKLSSNYIYNLKKEWRKTCDVLTEGLSKGKINPDDDPFCRTLNRLFDQASLDTTKPFFADSAEKNTRHEIASIAFFNSVREQFDQYTKNPDVARDLEAERNLFSEIRTIFVNTVFTVFTWGLGPVIKNLVFTPGDPFLLFTNTKKAINTAKDTFKNTEKAIQEESEPSSKFTK